jgi:hypothetical protein
MKKSYNSWVESKDDDRLSEFPFSVVHDGTIVGRFTTERYALFMMDMIVRAEMMHEIGNGAFDDIMNLLMDQVSDMQSRKWITPSK